jgi:hypothetical protein
LSWAGAFSYEDKRWKPSGTGFYVPVEPCLPFQAKFRDEMRNSGLFDQIPEKVWRIDWNVKSQPVGDSEASLKYLAPVHYSYAVCIRAFTSMSGSPVIALDKAGNKSSDSITRPVSIPTKTPARSITHIYETSRPPAAAAGFLNNGLRTTLSSQS